VRLVGYLKRNTSIKICHFQGCTICRNLLKFKPLYTIFVMY